MANKKKKGFFKEFKEFISRGNVLDMAVGIIVGGAFTAIITAIVSGILTPLLQAIGVGDNGFGVLQIILNKAAVDGGADPIILDFGIVISSIITFLLTAFILFLIVWTINRVREKAEEIKAKKTAAKAEGEAEEEPAAEEPPKPTVEELLAQIRDLLSAQNGGAPAVTEEKPDEKKE